MTLWDDHGFACSELRILPAGGSSNILVSLRSYKIEIDFRKERNRTLGKDCQFKTPAWEDLEVYDKEEN